MGLDITMVVDAGGDKPAVIDSLDFYVTYNLSPIYWELFGSRFVDVIEDRSGEETYATLRNAVYYLERHLGEFELMNPSNGWGSAQEFLEVLRKMTTAAKAYPHAMWSVWA